MLTTEALKSLPSNIPCSERYACDGVQTVAVYDCTGCNTVQCIHCERELHKLSRLSHHERKKLTSNPIEPGFCQLPPSTLTDDPVAYQRRPSDNSPQSADIVSETQVDLALCNAEALNLNHRREPRQKITSSARNSSGTACNPEASVNGTTADSEFESLSSDDDFLKLLSSTYDKLDITGAGADVFEEPAVYDMNSSPPPARINKNISPVASKGEFRTDTNLLKLGRAHQATMKPLSDLSAVNNVPRATISRSSAPVVSTTSQSNKPRHENMERARQTIDADKRNEVQNRVLQRSVMDFEPTCFELANQREELLVR